MLDGATELAVPQEFIALHLKSFRGDVNNRSPVLLIFRLKADTVLAATSYSTMRTYSSLDELLVSKEIKYREIVF
jgi:hypothetical protein